MAKATSAKKSDGKKKSKKKAAPEATLKVKVKSAKSDKPRKSAKSDGYDGLSKLVDHPLVADLLAAGAIAAVAAIAEHQLGSDKTKGQGSSKLIKSAGKAAASAMGKKLMGDISAIGGAAADAVKKA